MNSVLRKILKHIHYVNYLIKLKTYYFLFTFWLVQNTDSTQAADFSTKRIKITFIKIHALLAWLCLNMVKAITNNQLSILVWHHIHNKVKIDLILNLVVH